MIRSRGVGETASGAGVSDGVGRYSDTGKSRSSALSDPRENTANQWRMWSDCGLWKAYTGLHLNPGHGRRELSTRNEGPSVKNEREGRAGR